MATATLPPIAPRSPSPPAKATAAARAETGFSVQVVPSQDLSDLCDAWQDLANQALEPNCFYEPWMLLPALEYFSRGVSLEFILVHRNLPGRPAELVGLFPFERKRRLHGIPVRLLTLWQHLHCFLATPLVHREHGRETLRALLQWARCDRHGATLIELPFIASDGPFHQVLVDVLQELRSLTFQMESWNRAKMTPGADAEEYIQAALAPKHRREMARMRRRLGDLGRLESRTLGPNENLDPWIEQFLTLEASGWKGTENTALGCNADERAYFTNIVRAAQARGRLMMLGLFLDDQPVALKCNFLAGDGAFTFKIGFDERFDKYSPGVQLELDNIAAAHNLPGLAWMDSCAVANHSMINRLWTERRTLERLLISPGGWRGDLLVGLLPLLRSLKRLVRPVRVAQRETR